MDLYKIQANSKLRQRHSWKTAKTLSEFPGQRKTHRKKQRRPKESQAQVDTVDTYETNTMHWVARINTVSSA